MSNEDWHRAAAGTAGTRFQPWLRLQALPERGPALPHRAEAGGHSEPGGEGGRGGLWSRSVAGVGAPGWGQSVDVMISGLLAGAPRPASRAAQRIVCWRFFPSASPHSRPPTQNKQILKQKIFSPGYSGWWRRK